MLSQVPDRVTWAEMMERIRTGRDGGFEERFFNAELAPGSVLRVGPEIGAPAKWIGLFLSQESDCGIASCIVHGMWRRLFTVACNPGFFSLSG